MSQNENKIMMENLPIGSMKSDIENVLKGWVDEIIISKIDLVDNKKRKCKTAYVTLSCYSQVQQIIDFYSTNFDDQGFAFEDGFANIGMVRVKKYIGKAKPKNENDLNIKPLQNEENASNQDTERLFCPTEEDWDTETFDNENTQNIAEDSKYDENSSSQTLMFQQLPNRTTKSEVKELINQLQPETKIAHIDLKINTLHKQKLNAYVRFASQSDCNAIMNIFQEKYGEKGYWFVNQGNKSSTLKLMFYHGKKKETKQKVETRQEPNPEKKVEEFHVYLEKVPPQTTNEEITSILNKWLPPIFTVSKVVYHKDDKLFHVKLPSWEACDLLLSHFRVNFQPHGGFAFQNAKGRFNLIDVKRNESFYSKSTKQTLQNDASNNLELLKCSSVSSCNELHAELICPSPPSVSSSNDWKSVDINLQTEEISHNSVSSSSQPSRISGSLDPFLPTNSKENITNHLLQQEIDQTEIVLEENVSGELNTLMYEREELDDFRKEIMLLEDELKIKCPELFVSEFDMMLLRLDLNKMEAKKNELLIMKNKAQSELDELREQISCLNEGDA